MDEKNLSIKARIRNFQYEMEGVEILRTTEGYGYNYADLTSVLNAITPVLKKHKIWYAHETSYCTTTTCNIIITKIYCVDDEEQVAVAASLIDREAVLPKQNHFMKEGSGITYFRRYHMITLLGLNIEEDTDAGGKRVQQKTSSNTNSSSAKKQAPATSEADFVTLFTNMVEKKPKATVLKTLDMYKAQINNTDLKAINKIIDDKYGN